MCIRVISIPTTEELVCWRHGFKSPLWFFNWFFVVLGCCYFAHLSFTDFRLENSMGKTTPSTSSLTQNKCRNCLLTTECHAGPWTYFSPDLLPPPCAPLSWPHSLVLVLFFPFQTCWASSYLRVLVLAVPGSLPTDHSVAHSSLPLDLHSESDILPGQHI